MDDISKRSQLLELKTERDCYRKSVDDLNKKMSLLENIQQQLMTRCQALEDEKKQLNTRLTQKFPQK